jgi:prepilin-type processing-associated H-X9-DG protein
MSEIESSIAAPWPDSRMRTFTTGRKSYLGFTLTDLLVVIAGLSILAALFLPLISRARDSARTIACENNLHQIGLALNSYVNDFGAYPLYADDSANRATLRAGRWDTALLDYCGHNRKVFECPAWKWADVWGGGFPASPPVEKSVNGFNFCYGYNAFGTRPPPQEAGLGIGGLDFPNTRAVREAIVRQPNDMIAVGDYRGLMVYQANGLMNPWSYVDDHSNDYLRSRHLNGANVTFCDGRVESLGRKMRWPLRNADTDYAKRWNNDNQPHPETWPP